MSWKSRQEITSCKRCAVFDWLQFPQSSLFSFRSVGCSQVSQYNCLTGSAITVFDWAGSIFPNLLLIFLPLRWLFPSIPVQFLCLTGSAILCLTGSTITVFAWLNFCLFSFSVDCSQVSQYNSCVCIGSAILCLTGSTRLAQFSTIFCLFSFHFLDCSQISQYNSCGWLVAQYCVFDW